MSITYIDVSQSALLNGQGADLNVILSFCYEHHINIMLLGAHNLSDVLFILRNGLAQYLERKVKQL